MPSVADQLEEINAEIGAGLKDFQLATVNRIDELYRHGQMRMLVSDEVGLGKTLVARGTVAKVAQMRKEQHDNLVRVVYICSNATIADQNLSKLCINREVRKESASYSRLSMQHLNIFWQESDQELLKSYIQLIPLTPDTSFRMTSGAGTVSERALMYALLRRLPELKPYNKALEVAMIDYASSAWKDWAKGLYESQVVKCDKSCDGRYLQYMTGRLERSLEQKWKDGKSYFDGVISMCEEIKANGYHRTGNNGVIGALRVQFAKISLEKLEPDLVIMDEFQRFKYLINADPESEIGMLAGKFFNAENVRMLMLSATPYKMYSTLDEIDETDTDEHYSEFLGVMKFLNVSEEADKQFRLVWNNYSVQLKELTLGNTTILSAKNAAENAMYHSVCRTERIAAAESADLIDDSDVHRPITVTEKDVLSYVQAQKLMDDIAAPFGVPVDYIKSSPYILSFMRDYQLKRYIERKVTAEEVSKLNKDTLWISRKTIDQYDKIPNNNARLDRLMEKTMSDNAALLLWVPPSKPYYTPQGVFKNAVNFSKTLVFSSWEMVPRMIASLVSYESERRTVGKLAKASSLREAHYFSGDDKRYPSARLNFSVSLGQPKAMTLFCLMYPSVFLKDCYNPIKCVNDGMDLKDIEKDIRRKIAARLDAFTTSPFGIQDKRWYYLAPFLLDDPTYVKEWLGKGNEISAYDDEGTKKSKGFASHLKALASLYYDTADGKQTKLGRKPDDLIDVLTDMAIASPAVCCLRTYQSYLGDGRIDVALPSQIARLFINRMNSVESTAAVEIACGKKSDDAHWQNVLTYCKQGNFQSMFDEYAHLTANGLDSDGDTVAKLHRAIADSMNIRTTVYNVDTFKAFSARKNGKKEKTTGVRSHFAVAFTKGDNKDSDTDRKKAIRNAFNSPFRPFVLASTSIGQEGLDFHNYCRRIVHWNLPSNPIDLEQREGRINRFECLAIRQNIANRYGHIRFHKEIWPEMFEEAAKIEKMPGGSDLIPYWGLKPTEDMVKIERIVPMYPFSKDMTLYERLIKILSLYRLTLGQARQEELLEYIFQNCDDLGEMKQMFINLSPFYRNTGKN